MNAATTHLDSERAGRQGPAPWNGVALGIALLASAGSVYLSVGMGLKACPLCFYQRSFAIAALMALAVLLWLEGWRSPRACLVALPLAMAGLGVAVFHAYLVVSGKLVCPPAVLGWGDGPSQSLAAFVALTVTCLWGSGRGIRVARSGLLTLLLAVVLGIVAAGACIASAPPLPAAPSQPYDPAKQPFDTCRPPFPG
jgi:disulfide bond formation protein DsbB